MAIEIRTDTEIEAGLTVTFENPEVFPVNFWLSPERPAYVYNSTGLQAPVFSNHGTVDLLVTVGAYAIGFGIARTSGVEHGLFHNQSDGIFKVTSTYDYPPTESGFTWGFYAPQQSIDFLNDGVFEVYTPHGDATGVAMWSSTSTITNNGIIQVRAGVNAIGIYRPYAGYITNTGLIQVDGGVTAVGVEIGTYYYGFENSGTIIAHTGKESPYASIGVIVGISLDDIPGVPMKTYVNSGTIAADYAFWMNPGIGLATTLRSREELVNTGEINGVIGLAYGDDTLRNAGAISGFTDLGEGNDSYLGAAGLHSGIVAAGIGDDTLIGGSGVEVLFGEQGNDVIDAGGGNDFVDGGRGSDALDGGKGFDTLSYLQSNGAVNIDLTVGMANSADHDWVRNFEAVIGSNFADLIVGSDANEILEGAGGNDHIAAGAGNDTLLGDQGDDVLSGDIGADIFVFSAGDGHDEITDFNHVGSNDVLVIYGYSGYLKLQQIGVDALVTLTLDDSILLRNLTAASLTPDSMVFSLTPLAPAPVPLVPFTQTVIHDLVIQAGEELRFVNPQPRFINDQVFPNTGLVIEPLDHTALPSIFNAGTLYVEGTTTTESVKGIYRAIADSGTWFGESHIVNEATGLVDVVSLASMDALAVFADDSMWNEGLIRVSSTGGSATGVQLNGYRDSFVNSGTIGITAGQQGLGVDMEFDSSFWNSGHIGVVGSTSSVGVRWTGASYPGFRMQFVNTGTIEVSHTDVDPSNIGLSFSTLVDSPLIWNFGTIEADYAIRNVPFVTQDPAVASTIYNAGELRGKVVLAGGSDLLLNTGVITGFVDLGAGNDCYDGRLGSQFAGVFGGAGADVLMTGNGADALDGGDGNDTLSGGAGVDTLTGGAGIDSFRFAFGSGMDTVTDFLAGGAGEVIVVAGYSTYQTLEQQGADSLIMFSATDSLLLQNVSAANLVAADFQFSADSIRPEMIPAAPIAPVAPVKPVLANAPAFAAIEGGVGDDWLFGDLGPDQMRGGGGNDTLEGRSGDDFIDGGAGSDQLVGGLGNDTYYVDTQRDLVFENTGEGTDTIITSTSFYLYDNIENLMLASGAGDIFGSTNALDNTLIGNEGGNLLLGWDGNDTILGNTGNDILYGVEGNDSLLGGAGVDVLVGGNGSDTLDGGADSDALYGEDGNDVLYGGTGFVTDILIGGAGNDTLDGSASVASGELRNHGDYDLMDGGAGDDTYYVDTPADLTFEAIGGGTDTVIADINGGGYYLYANVENLTLTGNTPFGVGNELNNVLIGSNLSNWLLGGAGNDTINGKGGNDVLFGESGADTFVFEHGTGGDVIGDFTHGVDRIDISAIGYTSFAQLQSHMAENAGTSAIDLGNGDFIVIVGVAMNTLAAGDFVLA